MTELEMFKEIAALRGKVNYLRDLLSEVKFVLSLHPELKDEFNKVLEAINNENIKTYPRLNWD